jgi:hypothetical protein
MKPEEILQNVYDKAAAALNKSAVEDAAIRERVDFICRCMSNRAGVRLLMSCMLAKLHLGKIVASKTSRTAPVTSHAFCVIPYGGSVKRRSAFGRFGRISRQSAQ